MNKQNLDVISQSNETHEIGKEDLEVLAQKFHLSGGIPEDGSEALSNLITACQEYDAMIKAGKGEAAAAALAKLKLMFINPDEENLKGFATQVAESL